MILVEEQTYWDRPNKRLIRPFVVGAGVTHRGYSLPLEQAITDFGADNPFGKVSDKMKTCG
jgi:hypothetical protein